MFFDKFRKPKILAMLKPSLHALFDVYSAIVLTRLSEQEKKKMKKEKRENYFNQIHHVFGAYLFYS